ncbi:MAG: Gfo/Idh/MocA family oxidoreductase [Planctomycetes bacterium]|nr:Gfo/Idh/MocA family oxidoreductase [Planctomycetota bacterium]
MEQSTVRWGILSTARIATKVASAIHATAGAEVTAVASRTKERAELWAREHDVAASYGNYEALVEDEQLDAIYIPLPPSMHAEWTIRCAEAGKHVLCEKPLAMNVAEAQEMADACRANNVQLMDATMWVHHPRASDMLAPIQNGTLGELRRVTSAFSFDIEPYLNDKPPHMARDPESGKASPEAVLANELRFQRELGGGALMDLGWYNVGVALWALEDLPTRVFATARYRHDVEINLSAMMWYDDDRIVTFDCGYDQSLRKWFEVVGTAGSLVCDDFLNPWNSERPRFWLHDKSGQATEHVAAPVNQEQRMIERFCEIVRSGELDDTWPNISVANQRVCDAIGASARREEVVEIAR